MSMSTRELQDWDVKIKELVDRYGLNCYPQEFEVCDHNEMIGYMAYSGMPSRYAHWSFGKSFERQKTMYDYGVSGLPYEMVINSDPCIAYLMRDNTPLLHIPTIAHVYVLPFSAVEYLDVRPFDLNISGLTVRKGLISAMPYQSNSLSTLSCLHALEHIGRGRYGDEVDADGHRKAALELQRVLAIGGHLLIGIPVGESKICFDAHRILPPMRCCYFSRHLA